MMSMRMMLPASGAITCVRLLKRQGVLSGMSGDSSTLRADRSRMSPILFSKPGIDLGMLTEIVPTEVTAHKIKDLIRKTKYQKYHKGKDQKLNNIPHICHFYVLMAKKFIQAGLGVMCM